MKTIALKILAATLATIVGLSLVGLWGAAIIFGMIYFFEGEWWKFTGCFLFVCLGVGVLITIDDWLKVKKDLEARKEKTRET